jgi:hypothetical protein
MNELELDKAYASQLLGPWNRWSEVGAITFLALSHTFISMSIRISMSNILSFVSL